MSVFDGIRTALVQASDALTYQAMRFRNRTTMEAIVAGCAMISATDGKVDAEKKRKMVGFMSRTALGRLFTKGKLTWQPRNISPERSRLPEQAYCSA